MVMCAVCKTSSNDGALHCATCGEALVAAAPKVNLWKLVSVLVVALGGAFVYWHSRQPNTIISHGPPKTVNPLAAYSAQLTP